MSELSKESLKKLEGQKDIPVKLGTNGEIIGNASITKVRDGKLFCTLDIEETEKVNKVLSNNLKK